MATQQDVRRIALALPETVEHPDRFAFSVRNKGKLKGFVWVWLERIAPKKPRVPQPKVIAVRVANLVEKDFLLASDAKKFFTEPHYDGYPAVLIRLEAVTARELKPLIEQAWRCQAPHDLAKRHATPGAARIPAETTARKSKPARTKHKAAPAPLRGRIALVAGATRGAGRGIACMLGEAGATVYCTGRSIRGRPNMTGYFAGRSESIEETAERVTARGGTGVPVPVDHLDEAQVAALVERIRREQGKLDVLVNDISEGDVHEFKPFWELSLDRAFGMFRNAVHSHIITSRHAVPLMLKRKRTMPGLIVEVGDGDSLDYRGHLFYDLIKVAVSRLAFAMAEELHKHNIAAIAVTPGYMRTETMLEAFGVTEANWRDGAKKDPNFLASETPFFVGRAIAALAADPGVMEKSGGLYGSWTLSDEYGFTDVDGNRPHLGRHFRKVYGEEPPTGPRKTAFHWAVGRGPGPAAPQKKRPAATARKKERTSKAK